jgi:hypothetical protein
VVGYAELGSRTIVAEAVASHRALAIEQTEAALDHFLDLKRRLSEVLRGHESNRQFQDEGGSFSRSQAAIEEKRAWEKWMTIIQQALRHAEEEIIAAVQAWDDVRRPSDGDDGCTRGVIYKGRLYLTVPSGEGDRRLVVADLKASLNLDRSLAVVDLIG